MGRGRAHRQHNSTINKQTKNHMKFIKYFIHNNLQFLMDIHRIQSILP